MRNNFTPQWTCDAVPKEVYTDHACGPHLRTTPADHTRRPHLLTLHCAPFPTTPKDVSIDMDHFHEETFRNMEALKVNKPGITWSFSRRTLKSDAYRPGVGKLFDSRATMGS